MSPDPVEAPLVCAGGYIVVWFARLENASGASTGNGQIVFILFSFKNYNDLFIRRTLRYTGFTTFSYIGKVSIL